MEMTYDLAIAGGGPAGCAAAITAARLGNRVLLCEKGRYPRHRVCGEFISAESHQLLADLLGKDHPLLQVAPRIQHARMFIEDKCINFHPEEPGWSISRFDLDHALWQAALAAGVDAQQSSNVSEIGKDYLRLQNERVAAGAIINASGRWSNLPRPPIARSKDSWIGLKAHFTGEMAPLCTDLYFFNGGYCGVQPLSHARLNACAMVRSHRATSLQEVFAAYPQLWARSRAWEQITETTTTAPLIHSVPEPVSEDIINVGDAAAFIDPYTGDGISLALRSGVLAIECALEGGPQSYADLYRQRFARAFRVATFTRSLARAPRHVRLIAAYAFRSESLRNWALRNTRGI